MKKNWMQLMSLALNVVSDGATVREGLGNWWNASDLLPRQRESWGEEDEYPVLNWK